MAKSVVNESRPASTFLTIHSATSGSAMPISPASSEDTRARFLSRHVTLWPSSERQTELTNPT